MDGFIPDEQVDHSIGIRPAFYLNLSTLNMSGSGIISDPYTILKGKKLVTSYDGGCIYINAVGDTNINLYVACYDDNKKLKSCDVKKIFVSEGANTIKIDSIDMESYVKFLVWDENMSLLYDEIKLE